MNLHLPGRTGPDVAIPSEGHRMEKLTAKFFMRVLLDGSFFQSEIPTADKHLSLQKLNADHQSFSQRQPPTKKFQRGLKEGLRG